MKVREPVPRPLDVIAAELLVSVTQAFLAGVLAFLAVGFWAERGVGTGPVVALLAAAGLAVSAAWLYWLLGGEGWPMALACLPIALVMGSALLIGAQGTPFLDLDAPLLLLTLAASLYGVAAGFFLDSPRRWRWDQRRTPRPGRSVPRISPTTERALSVMPRVVPGRRTSPPRSGSPRPPVAPGNVDEDATGPASRRPIPSLRMATPKPSPGRSDAIRRPQASLLEPPGTVTLERPATAPPAPDTHGERDRTAADEAIAPPAPARVELPMTETQKVRRSPWAWASPPEWNRDEPEDEPVEGTRRDA
jgi:hypothetical protein